MAKKSSLPAFNCCNSADEVYPLDAAEKVDVLAEIVNDLLTELVNEGRISRVEERAWRAATEAVVLDRPELVQAGGTVLAEAEKIAIAAALRDE